MSDKFTMDEPREIGIKSRYAFWLHTSDQRLIDFTRSLLCVVAVNVTDGNRALVDIGDDYDADEAWHWIRTELEQESQVIVLDKIWEDAIMWL
ncbi:MAG: hypothetical protein K8L99_19480 [Anaerolineae bacterium]|nr:hypothetical protein [Anaerolineae bacterium]